jgi:hypothetical protein
MIGAIGCREELRMAHQPHHPISVRRHPITAIEVYDVTSEELDELERSGLRGTEDFGFSIFGFSSGITLAATVLSVDIKPDRLNQIFWSAMLLAFAIGVYCGIRWIISRKSVRTIAQRIRARVEPLGDQESGVEPAESSQVTETLIPRGGGT